MLVEVEGGLLLVLLVSELNSSEWRKLQNEEDLEEVENDIDFIGKL